MGWFTDLTLDVLDGTFGAAKRAYDDSQARREQERLHREWEERDRQWREKRERDRQRAEERRERERERAEREKAIRLASLKSDTESAARELSSYKSYTVNPELSSQTLKEQTAMRVSRGDMDNDAKDKIGRHIKYDQTTETSDLKRELDTVDDLLDKISRIERAGK